MLDNGIKGRRRMGGEEKLFAHLQVDSEVLTQLLRASKFSEFESHMYSLKEFYAQSSSSNEATNMYRVLTSIESMLLCITKVRQVGGVPPSPSIASNSF